MTEEKTLEALHQLELQMEDGYIDIGRILDSAEFELVQAALAEYRRNHNL